MFDLRELHDYYGRYINDVIDDLDNVVTKAGYSLNVQDPVFNRYNIDTNPKRVNILTDDNGTIIGSKIG